MNYAIPDNLQIEKSADTDSNIYVKSEFFKNYSSDMYVDMDKHMSANTKPSTLLRKDGGRPLFMGTRNAVFKTLNKAFKEVKYQNFENIMPASLLIGDFDIHIGNIGIIRDPKNPATLPKMVRIDFAGSLDKLTNNIHPHSRLRHLPGFGPTNHFREFSSKLRRNNPEFADNLLASSKINLDSAIDKSFEEMTKYYSNDALAAWAKQAMPKVFNKKKALEVTAEEIKNSFKDTMKKRQESLKEYGLEVKLGTLVTKKLTFPYYQIDEKQLKTLMQEYPDHFENIINYEKGKNGGKKLKISDKSLRSNKVFNILHTLLKTFFPNNKIFRNTAEKHLMEKITSLAEKIKTPEIKGNNKELEEKISRKDLKVVEELRNIFADVSKITSKSISPSIVKKISKLKERRRG